MKSRSEAAVWAAAEPGARRLFGTTYSDVRLLGAMVTRRRKDGTLIEVSPRWAPNMVTAIGRLKALEAALPRIKARLAKLKLDPDVTWVDGELWHGTWEGDESDLRRVDPRTGEVLERLEMPPGVGVSGLESDGGDQFFCGGGSSGKVRAVRRPR